MKVKAKIMPAKIIHLEYGDYKVNVDLNRTKSIDGYIPIMDVKELPNKMLEVMTAVLTEDLKLVVPFRKDVVDYDSFKSYKYNNEVNVYKNKKAIYKVSEEEFYVIDLENTKFVNIDGTIIPSNPLQSMVAYYGIDDKKIIMYSYDKACIYNVCNDKLISNVYEMIEPNYEMKNRYNAYYVIKNKYINPLYIQMMITDNGGIVNQAILNNEVLSYLPNSILGDKDKTIKYCDECYNSYYEDLLEKKEITKRLQ